MEFPKRRFGASDLVLPANDPNEQSDLYWNGSHPWQLLPQVDKELRHERPPDRPLPTGFIRWSFNTIGSRSPPHIMEMSHGLHVSHDDSAAHDAAALQRGKMIWYRRS